MKLFPFSFSCLTVVPVAVHGQRNCGLDEQEVTGDGANHQEAYSKEARLRRSVSEVNPN